MKIIHRSKWLNILPLLAVCIFSAPALCSAQDSWKINKNLRCEDGQIVSDRAPLFDFEIEAIAKHVRDQIRSLTQKIRKNKANGLRVKRLQQKRRKKRQMLARMRKCENQTDIPLPPNVNPTPYPPNEDPFSTPFNRLPRDIALEYCGMEQDYFYSHSGPESICDINSFREADSNSSINIEGCNDVKNACLDTTELSSCSLVVNLRYDCEATAAELLRCSNAITDALRKQAQDYNCRSFFYENPDDYRAIDLTNLPACKSVRENCSEGFSTLPSLDE